MNNPGVKSITCPVYGNRSSVKKEIILFPNPYNEDMPDITLVPFEMIDINCNYIKPQ